MTAQSRDYLKAKFQTGIAPPQQDWQDLIDSFMLVDAQFWTDATTGDLWIDADSGDPWQE